MDELGHIWEHDFIWEAFGMHYDIDLFAKEYMYDSIASKTAAVADGHANYFETQADEENQIKQQAAVLRD